MAQLARRCVDNGWTRFEWTVLDWNTPSIDFYKSIGAKVMDDWKICRLTGDALKQFAREGAMKIVLVAAIGENNVIGREGAVAVAAEIRPAAFPPRDHQPAGDHGPQDI